MPTMGGTPPLPQPLSGSHQPAPAVLSFGARGSWNRSQLETMLRSQLFRLSQHTFESRVSLYFLIATGTKTCFLCKVLAIQQMCCPGRAACRAPIPVQHSSSFGASPGRVPTFPLPQEPPPRALHVGGFWVLAPVLLSMCGGSAKGLSTSPGGERQPSHPPSRNLPNRPPPPLLRQALPWGNGWRARGEQHPRVRAHTEGPGSRTVPQVPQPSGAVGGMENVML